MLILMVHFEEKSKKTGQKVFISFIFYDEVNLGHLVLSKGLIGYIYGFLEEIFSNSTGAPKFYSLVKSLLLRFRKNSKFANFKQAYLEK